LNKNIKIILNYFIGPLVFLLLSYFIWWQVTHQHDWRGSLDKVCRAMTGPQQWKLWLIVALMPLNWGIEARKWQLALRPVGGISYRNAFKAIFTGATMASFTPNRMGEYLGRILYVKEGKRLAAISLTIVCSIAQLLITLTIGIIGILYIRYTLHQSIFRESNHGEFWLNTVLCVAFLDPEEDTGIGEIPCLYKSFRKFRCSDLIANIVLIFCPVCRFHCSVWPGIPFIRGIPQPRTDLGRGQRGFPGDGSCSYLYLPDRAGAQMGSEHTGAGAVQREYGGYFCRLFCDLADQPDHTCSDRELVNIKYQTI
jgi:hypothetical protein